MAKKGFVIFLTATINPNGMPFTVLQDKSVREKQYREALLFYLLNTDCKIVFCENSGIDISGDFKDYVDDGRVEFLIFEGNDINKDRGKGYGEAAIIQYAIDNSVFLNNARYVIKVTGRLVVRNIVELLESKVLCLRDDVIRCDFMNDTAICTMTYICPLKWLKSVAAHKEKINDMNGVWIEHLMYDMLLLSDCCVVPFLTSPLIEGVSGSSGMDYKPIPNIYLSNIRCLSSLLKKKHCVWFAFFCKIAYILMLCFNRIRS